MRKKTVKLLRHLIGNRSMDAMRVINEIMLVTNIGIVEMKKTNWSKASDFELKAWKPYQVDNSIRASSIQ